MSTETKVWNDGLPAGYTACERYRGYTIAISDGWYRAFDDHGHILSSAASGATREKVRRIIDSVEAEA